MGWNRERIVFALSLLILVGSIVHASTSFFGDAGEEITLSEPRAATVGEVAGEVVLDWFKGGQGALRNPFEAKSEWRPARPDALPAPPYTDLLRRVPLPGTVAGAPRAWPSLEETPPEVE